MPVSQTVPVALPPPKQPAVSFPTPAVHPLSDATGPALHAFAAVPPALQLYKAY